MKVIYGINQIRRYKRPVVALGVFDGVHRGHINILKGAVKKAREIKGTSMVLTFWPHPQKEESLYSLEHRLRLFRKIGVDACVVINFNQKFADISALDFVKNILFKKINTHYVYIGKNFRFGKNAEGNFETLYRLSSIYNFKVKVFKVIKIKNKPISSTYIRTLIKKGKLTFAQRLLTRPVSILGTVIKGISLAKKLGFPTANIDPHHEVIPPHGVYAVRVIFNDNKFHGICYIGSKPTFLTQRILAKIPATKICATNIGASAHSYGGGESAKNFGGKPSDSENVEVYIFDFNKNIYGRNLEIQFLRKIRDEKKFASATALTAQIKKDIFSVKK